MKGTTEHHRDQMRQRLERALGQARRKAKREGRAVTNADIAQAMKGGGFDPSGVAAMIRYVEGRGPGSTANGSIKRVLKSA
jgi:hypothetical protein